MAQRCGNCAVVAVAYDESMDAPLVLLREEADGRIMSVPVGPFEASSIIMAAEGLLPSQPQTHDVLAELFKRHGLRMEGFEIRGNALSGYYGRLYYRKGLFRHSMDISPSDGIALALRLGKPIMADKTLKDAALSAEQCAAARFKTDHILFLDNGLQEPLSLSLR